MVDETKEMTGPGVHGRYGPYLPKRLLGEGGMGQVFLADGPGGEQVALKVLGAAPADSALAARLTRERQVLEGLDHPHIVRVREHGTDSTGRPYVALEYVEGRSLGDILKDRPGQRLPLDKAVLILDACADALAAIHARGVLHRDVKPGNVLVTKDGDVKLIDFGLALAEDVSRRLTRKMEVVGTPAYLPPEVLLRTQDWSPASDLYSLGCLAYHVLAGEPPFCGDLQQVLAGQMWVAPPSIRSVAPATPPALVSLIEELLEKEPELRPTPARVREVLALFQPDQGKSFWLAGGDGPHPFGFAPEETRVPLPGTTFGRYRLLEERGRGGMGVVYKAEDTQLKRTVALKLILGGGFASDEARRRFYREAEAVAALDHPTIVRVFDVGEHDDIPFLSMELVEGRSLPEIYPEEPELGPLLETFVRICDGVQHAHLRGVIHRDLKPQNVLVDEELNPRILDFGLAKRVAEEDLTDAGSILGTLRYMAPEQIQGENARVDVRSDVYGLGGILYELVTRGRAPFEGVPARIAYELVKHDPPPPSARERSVPWELDAICLKAIEKDPDHRYQSALAFQRDVERYLSDLPIEARQASLLYRFRKGVRRHKAAVAVASLLILGTAGAVVTAALEDRTQRLEVARLIDEAHAAPLAERPRLFSEILGIDPGNRIATVERDAAERELLSQEALRLEKERGKRELAEEALRTSQAQAGLRAVEERNRARREAEEEERKKARTRAKEALDRADEAEQAFEKISALREGLVLLAPGSGGLRDTLETRVVETAARLTETALQRGEPGLARFWLREAGQVEAAKAQTEALASMLRRVERLESGQGNRDEAVELMRRGEWLAARDKLLLAKRKGVAVAEDLGVVESRCRENAEALLGEGHRHLGEKNGALALQKSREALRWVESDEAKELIEAAAERVATDAQIAALAGESTLETTVKVVAGTAAGERLARELRHRRLQTAGLAYVPAFASLKNEPFFIAKKEVTNAEFLAFVKAGGYADQTLFDAAARAHLGTFLDATPGSDKSPGPRVWQYGGYGDPANAQRPVRGVTWYEARAYARWKSRTTGQRWRLPTAREWEVAAGFVPGEQRFRNYPYGDAFDADKPDRSALGIDDAGGSVSEWVVTAEGRPALKGASFAVPVAVARHQALVSTTGSPPALPPDALTKRLGFRLVMEPPK